MTVKALFLVDHLRENGGLRVAHDLARRLRTAGTKAEFFVLQTHSDGAVLELDQQIPMTAGNQRSRKFRWAIPIGAFRLVRAARNFDVIVSVSETGFTLLLGRLVSRMVRRPFVVFVQSPLADSIALWVPHNVQVFSRWVNAHADAAICVSPELIPGVIANGLPADATFAVTVGLDVDRNQRRARASSTVQPPSGRYLVAVGRLSSQKGFDLLIRAHALVLAAGEPHTLVIVGEGPDRADLEQLAADLNVQDSVLLVGFVANPHPLLAGADLFVLSSRREGMGGLVLLEALGHGVPLVATDCMTGPRALLDDGRLGALVPPEDVDALAAAILRHMRHPEELRAKALGGPNRARDFDPARAATEFLDILQLVIARHSAQRGPHRQQRLNRTPPPAPAKVISRSGHDGPAAPDNVPVALQDPSGSV